MQTLTDIAQAFWRMSLDAGPWLLFGLVAAGLIRAFMPERLMARWLGGAGVKPIFTAAFVGTPLPLCSCSVIPAALALRRGGASRGATTSFLVSTPENGADSILLSYAMLGPFMTIARPVAAIGSAVATGLLARRFGEDRDRAPAREQTPDPDAPDHACHAHETHETHEPPQAQTQTQTHSQTQTHDCCQSAVSSGPNGPDQPASGRADTASTAGERLRAGLRFAFVDLFDDIAIWLFLGLVAAALIAGLVPIGGLGQWGHGWLAMIAMLAISVPMYVCATASTPIAAGMLLAGASPGAVLVFLLAGPATNLGTLGVIKKELGWSNAACYLGGIVVTSLGFGWLTDQIAAGLVIDVVAQASQGHELLPAWLAATGAGLLYLMFARVGWRRLTRKSTAADDPASHDVDREIENRPVRRPADPRTDTSATVPAPASNP